MRERDSAGAAAALRGLVETIGITASIRSRLYELAPGVRGGRT